MDSSSLIGLSVDRESRLPAYAQICEHLLPIVHERQRRGITEFFTDNDLVGHFGVSRMTARQALGELVREGLLLRQQGVGTFVAPPKVTEQEGPVGDFFDDWTAQGHRVEVEVPEFYRTHAGPAAAALGISSRSMVLFFRRRRLVDGEPVGVDERWVPKPADSHLTREELSCRSIHLILVERIGLRVDRARVEIEAAACNAAEASMLDLEAGEPVLIRGVTPLTADGRPAWTGRSVYRADRYKYSTVVRAQ